VLSAASGCTYGALNEFTFAMGRRRFLAVVMGDQFSVIGCQLSVVSCQLELRCGVGAILLG
jgi:hypothetical protein